MDADLKKKPNAPAGGWHSEDSHGRDARATTKKRATFFGGLGRGSFRIRRTERWGIAAAMPYRCAGETPALPGWAPDEKLTSAWFDGCV
jgi:hypothetical protein